MAPHLGRSGFRREGPHPPGAVERRRRRAGDDEFAVPARRCRCAVGQYAMVRSGSSQVSVQPHARAREAQAAGGTRRSRARAPPRLPWAQSAGSRAWHNQRVPLRVGCSRTTGRGHGVTLCALAERAAPTFAGTSHSRPVALVCSSPAAARQPLPAAPWSSIGSQRRQRRRVADHQPRSRHGQGRRIGGDTTGTATDSGYSRPRTTGTSRCGRGASSRGAVQMSARATTTGRRAVHRRARADRHRAGVDVCVSIPTPTAAGLGRRVSRHRAALIRGLTDYIFGGRIAWRSTLRAAFRAATGAPYSATPAGPGIDRRSSISGGFDSRTFRPSSSRPGTCANARDAAGCAARGYRLRVARGIANGIRLSVQVAGMRGLGRDERARRAAHRVRSASRPSSRRWPFQGR